MRDGGFGLMVVIEVDKVSIESSFEYSSSCIRIAKRSSVDNMAACWALGCWIVVGSVIVGIGWLLLAAIGCSARV